MGMYTHFICRYLDIECKSDGRNIDIPDKKLGEKKSAQVLHCEILCAILYQSNGLPEVPC